MIATPARLLPARGLRPALRTGLLLLGACTGSKGSPDDSGVDADGGTITLDGGGTMEEDCGDHTPVLTQGPYCRYLGLIQPEGAVTAMPTLEIWAVATDEDGDLHYQAVRTWFDGEPLGEIDTTTAAYQEKDRFQAGDHPCMKTDADPSDRWFLTDKRVEWGAMYDWGISVQDAAGHWSEMAITTCAAPTADGLEP